MRKTKALLSAVLALLLVCTSFTANALYMKGDTIASYAIKESEAHILGDGLTYNEFTFDDATGKEQVCFTMEFDPKKSDFRTYIYHKTASAGYTIADDAAAAYAEGLEVYAAVNGDFFSMESDSYGTPIGLYATEGKLVASSAGLSYPNLVIGPDGAASVVDSKLVYAVNIDGKDYTQLAAVNKKGVRSDSNIYYYDRDLGDTTPLGTSRFRQIVCDIKDGVIGVGKTLTGTVAEIKEASMANIGENQFVLSVGGDIDITGADVGDTVTVKVEESVAASREAMNAAEHIISCRYVLVRDGVDQKVVASGMSDILAQRCVFGIRPDGSIVYMVCDGRRNTAGGANGLTFEQIVEIMLAYGCSDVVNFDGGGSTAVILSEGNGQFNYEFIGEGDGRRVSNSILIVRDPDADPLPEKEYKPFTEDPEKELRNVALNKPYKVAYNGIMTPKYTTSLTGDEYLFKMTDGRYRTNEDNAKRYAVEFLGSNFNETYVIDLEKDRTDLRNIVFKNVLSTGTNGFKENNVIVYVSDDGMNWSMSVDNEVTKAEAALDGAYDYTCAFKEPVSGRYVKIVIGSPTTSMSFDEIEVNGMVSKDEPAEELKPEDPSLYPAEEPTEVNRNVAAGKSYHILDDGEEIAGWKDTDVELRYYSKPCADTEPPKLTDGKVGTSSGYQDGPTLAWRSGTDSLVEITLDLEYVYSDLEFVQLRNIINNGASFGHTTTADISYSTDGENYTDATGKTALTMTPGTFYYNLTVQLDQPFSARYVKVSFKTTKFLFGLEELTVCTSATDVTLGDTDGDGNINSLDAVKLLQFDAGLAEATNEVLLAGDVNFDGKVDNLDAVQILSTDAGLGE